MAVGFGETYLPEELDTGEKQGEGQVPLDKSALYRCVLGVENMGCDGDGDDVPNGELLRGRTCDAICKP